MEEECFYIARRAVAAFKFPKISTDYEVVYYVRNENGIFEEVDEDDENFNEAIPHAYFLNELSYDEIEIILA